MTALTYTHTSTRTLRQCGTLTCTQHHTKTWDSRHHLLYKCTHPRWLEHQLHPTTTYSGHYRPSTP